MFDRTNDLQEAIKQLELAQDGHSFQMAVTVLADHMKNMGIDSRYLTGLEQRAYYVQNDYSDKDTKSKMSEAKMRVIQYANEILNTDKRDSLLINILENFYLFLVFMIKKKS